MRDMTTLQQVLYVRKKKAALDIIIDARVTLGNTCPYSVYVLKHSTVVYIQM